MRTKGSNVLCVMTSLDMSEILGKEYSINKAKRSPMKGSKRKHESKTVFHYSSCQGRSLRKPAVIAVD